MTIIIIQINTIDDDNNINNDDNGIVPYKKKGINNSNSNLNINIKSERNDLLESKEKDFITIKKIKSNYKPKENNIIVEEYEEEKEIKKEEDNSGLYTSIKKEQSLLRISYEKYLIKHHPNILSRFLA